MKKYLVIAFLVVLVSVSLANADIVRTLKLGSTGSDVRDLQVLLNKDPETAVATVGAGSPGNESQYFGSLTRAAVLKFQTKYADEVLYPIGLSFATGVVGPQTRNKINKLFSSNSSESNLPLPPVVLNVPHINSISPDVVTANPQMITISGTDFTTYGNKIIIANDNDKGIGYYNSADGKTITFPFVSTFAEKIKVQLSAYKGTSNYQAILSAFTANLTGENISVEDGVTYVRAIILVKNAGGTSNSFDIKINIKSLLQ